MPQVVNGTLVRAVSKIRIILEFTVYWATSLQLQQLLTYIGTVSCGKCFDTKSVKLRHNTACPCLGTIPKSVFVHITLTEWCIDMKY